MKLHESEQQGLPRWLLIHSGALTKEMWKPISEHFSSQYAIDFVTISGHGDDSETDFISIQKEAETILEALQDKKYHTIWGVAFGGQIALRMIELSLHCCEHLLLESTLLYSSGIYGKIMYWSNKIQYRPKKEERKLGNLSRVSFLNLLKENGSYCFQKEKVACFEGTIHLMIGGKEDNLIGTSQYRFKDEVSKASLYIFETLDHGITNQYPEAMIAYLETYFVAIDEKENI